MLSPERSVEVALRGGGAHWSDAVSAIQRLTSTSAALQAQTEETQRLSDVVQTANEWNTALRVSVTYEAADISALKRDLAALQTDENRARQRTQDTTAQQALHTTALAEERCTQAALQRELLSLRGRVQANGQRLSALSNDKQEIERKLYLAELEFASLSEQLTSCRFANSLLQSSRDTAKYELSRLTTEQRALTQRFDSLRRQLQSRTPPEALLCIACFETRLEVLLKPCSHLCLCSRCARKTNKCPLCRQLWSTYEFVYV